MGSTQFRDLQSLSSTLASLRMLQPRAFGSLNCVDPLDSVSNYYLVNYYSLELMLRNSNKDPCWNSLTIEV